jgi:alpha-mannosidase
MSKKEAVHFSGLSIPELDPVRVIEDGPVRIVVEALFKYGESSICQRYKFQKAGKELEVEVRVFWNEKDRMLKLSIPSKFTDGRCKGQVAYGVEDFQRETEELVAQKWVAVVSENEKNALTVVNNGTYGFDFSSGELRLSLLRSAAYAGHPVEEGRPIVRQDRFETRIDQGERLYRFWFKGESASERLTSIDREALAKNEMPVTLCCYPSGEGDLPHQGIFLSNPAVQLTALKMAEEKNWMIVRLFEPTGEERTTRVNMPFRNLGFDVSLKAFEVKSLALDLDTDEFFEVDMLENKIAKV